MAKYDPMGDKIKRRVPIAVWVMLLGLIIGFAGVLCCFSYGLDSYINTESFSRSYDVPDIYQCSFEFAGGNNKIVRSNDNKIHITANNVVKDFYTVQYKFRKFIFEPKHFTLNASHIVAASQNFFGLYQNRSEITIALPDTIYYKLEIHNRTGDLSIDHITARNLDISNDLGKITANSVSAYKSEIDNAIGEISLRSCNLGETELDNGIGQIILEVCNLSETSIDNGIGKTSVHGQIKGDIEVDNGIGDCDLNIIGSSSDYTIKGDSDGVKWSGVLDSHVPKYKIELDRGIGDITVVFS